MTHLKVAFSVEVSVPTRLKIAILMFLSCFVMYGLRVNISLVMIAMMRDDSTISWTKKEQSLVLGGYFYGYLCTSLIASIVVQKFSSRDLIGLSLFASGIVTGLSVYTVQESIVPFFMTRFILGALAGFIYPSVQYLISRWSPPEEKGKFVFTMLGGNFGTVVTWATLGPLIEFLDWKCAMFITGMISIIFSIIWFYHVADTPRDHPRISKDEIEYIQSSIGDSVSKSQNHSLPLCEILTSIPFLALLILHFGNLLGLFFLITATPRFMTDVLQFRLANAGCLSSLPYLMRIICGFVFGWIGDYQLRNNVLKVTTIRKFYCIFSHIIPGLLLILLCFVGFSVHACIAIITLSLGFNGAATITSLQNSQDLAPNFAGSLYAIINFVGTTSGIIAPMIIAHFTEKHDFNSWKIVFFLGAAFYIISAIVFIILGSGTQQKWNEPKSNQRRSSAMVSP